MLDKLVLFKNVNKSIVVCYEKFIENAFFKFKMAVGTSPLVVIFRT